MSNESEAEDNPEIRICRVLAAYQSSNSDPISVDAGDSLIVNEKADYWNGNPNWKWIWCTNSQGKSGWVPQDCIDFSANGTNSIARYKYVATELTVAVGDELVVGREESGWFWCTDKQGKSGWVPADHITGDQE